MQKIYQAYQKKRIKNNFKIVAELEKIKEKNKNYKYKKRWDKILSKIN